MYRKHKRENVARITTGVFWGCCFFFFFFSNLITEQACKGKYLPANMLKPFLIAQQNFCLIAKK